MFPEMLWDLNFRPYVTKRQAISFPEIHYSPRSLQNDQLSHSLLHSSITI